jgi:biopolymer transport protein ExbB/TolQ
MKHLLISLLFFNILHAAQTPIFQMSIYTGVLFFFLLVVIVIIFILIKKRSKTAQLLEEKDEKIKWLRQISAQNDHRHAQKEQEMEKEIMKLTHTIENLELKLKEGTKNQVIAKIEELQSKRQTAQSRIEE